MQGKRVVVVGDAFYKNKGITFDVSNLNQLGKVINQALESSPPSMERIQDFLAKAYQWSYPCELFYMQDSNLESSYQSFYTYLTTEVFEQQQAHT